MDPWRYIIGELCNSRIPQTGNSLLTSVIPLVYLTHDFNILDYGSVISRSESDKDRSTIDLIRY
jgi:hypothetical protein